MKILFAIFTYILYSSTFAQVSDQKLTQPASVAKEELNEDQLDSFVNAYFYKRSSFVNKFSKDISSQDQEELDLIVSNIKSVSPKSSDYYYIEYINRGRSVAAFDYLQKAEAAYPNNVEYYDDFIYHYELTNDISQRTNYSKKLSESNTIHEALVEYNYNVLMSLKPNAILITNGSDDTFPIFILQDVQKIRTDVTVINIDMLSEDIYISNKSKDIQIKKQKNTIKTVEYLIENNPSKEIYLGHTVNQQILSKYQEKLYLTGLTYQYSTTPVNNIKVALDNYENHFKLDQLNRPTSNKSINQINFNYTLPLLTFLEYYKSNGENTKYRNTKELILTIAKRVNQDTFIMDYINAHDL
jgi:hypothetical protein